jgi:uncharacterized protein with beta-barrel porin domain
LTNNGQLNGGASITGGTLSNNLTITGNVSNAGTGTFNNNANGTVSGLLTNTLSNTVNAGQLNGGVLVSGGTVSNSNTVTHGVTVSGTGTYTQTAGTTSGGLTSGNIVNADGGAINGAISNNAGGTFNAGSTVTSDGAFNNASGATLAVAGAGNYTIGGVLTNAGAVTVASGGTLVATAGGITNTSSGTITNTGTIRDDLNNAGAVTNNGAYIANVATNTGSVTNNNTWTGNVLSSAGSIVNAASATWTGDISTGGTFTNAGIVTGTLTNTAGTTTNNGAISGAVTVSGGTFKGTGSTGGLTIGSGAAFAPGNGTPGSSATVNGSLAFSSGAFFQVAVNPTTASFVSATGAATLGGASVQAFFSSGTYVVKQYTILNAAGGLGGSTFGSQANTNLPSGFTTAFSYDPTHAYLDLSLAFVPPPGTGLSVNQQNVANAIVNAFNINGTVPIAFGALTPAGLTQISGETATGTQQTTFNAMNLFMGVMTDPFMAGRGDGVSGGGNAASYADEAALGYANGRRPNDALAAIYTKARPMVPTFEQRWSTWVAGYGGSQSTDGNTALGSNNTTSSVYGTAVGADYRFSPDTVAGFSLAGGGTNFSVANGGSGRSDLFQAGAFIRHTAGPAYVSAALAYGWQDITTDRTVTVAGVDRLHAEFNANAWSGRAEGGYRFVTPFIGITPYAAGQFTTFELPSYAEGVVSGASTFALSYGAKSVTDARSELGVRTDKSWALQDSVLTLRGRVAWAHDYDPDRSIGATLQALPGASFVVNGAAQASDSALTTAAAEIKWMNGWSAAATFEGEFSDVTRSYAGKGVVRYAW